MSPENGVESVPEVKQAEDTTLQDHSSDGEGAERTAREKLKKTSIAGLAQYSKGKVVGIDGLISSEANDVDLPSEAQTENGLRGRPSKKRSFEDLQTEDSGASIENGGPPLPKKGLHKRMRSRDISENDHIKGLEKLEDVASPVQEESDAEAHKSPGGPGILVSAPSKEEGEVTSPAAETTETTDRPKEPEPTAATSTSKEAESKPQTTSSGFANTSVTSPFSSFKSPKSPPKELETASSPETTTTTTTSAFASSGLSAFASYEKSPFGMVGSTAKTGGGFGGGAASGGFGPASSIAGAASPFASKPSSGFGSGGGFGSAGGFGGGFGAAKPFGTSTSSFAAPGGALGTFGKAKPFGSSHDDEEDGSDDGGEGEDGPQAEDDAAPDPRFHEQEVETGEEDEITIFSCRAKLYHFEKEWKERGTGHFKINMRYENKAMSSEAEDEKSDGGEADEESGGQTAFTRVERKARLIMRTDGVHRLVLNTPVFKDMNVGTHDGKEPSGRTMHLTGLEEGKPTGYQIKVAKEDLLKEIYTKIRELQEDL